MEKENSNSQTTAIKKISITFSDPIVYNLLLMNAVDRVEGVFKRPFELTHGQWSWPNYFNTRFPRAFECSPIGKNLTTSWDKMNYLSRVGQVARDMTARLSINPHFFLLGTESEAFLAVCDSWVENDEWPEAAHDNLERDFLDAYLKILTAGYTVEQDPILERDRAAKKDARLLEITQNYRNAPQSKFLAVLMKDWVPDSLLADGRKFLGINSIQDEINYDVHVLNLSINRRVKPDGSMTEWEFKTSVPGSIAFVYYSHCRPIILCSSDTVDQMLEGNGSRAQAARRLPIHEYFHTQRSLTFGMERLGRYFDELGAATTADDQSYADIKLLVDILDGCSGGELYRIFSPVLQGLEYHLFYQCLSKMVGFKNLLMLTAAKPSNYPALKTDPKVPKVTGEGLQATAGLIGQVIEAIQEFDPQKLNTLALADTQKAKSIQDRALNLRISLPSSLFNLTKD